MRIGGALVVIALGAILDFAVSLHNDHGFDVNTIGVILMVVGAVWLIAELAYSFSRRRTDVIHRGPAGPVQGTTYIEPPVDYR
jgi:hypothetical protein